MRILSGHHARITRILFSADSGSLLSFGAAGSMDAPWIWNLSSGTGRSLPTVQGAAFTPNSRYLACCIEGDFKDEAPTPPPVVLVDVRDPGAGVVSVPLKGNDPDDFMNPIVSPDGKRFLTFNHTEAFVLNWWSYPGWKSVARWELGETFTPTGSYGVDRFDAVVISPDGKSLVGSNSGGAYFLSVVGGKQIRYHPYVYPQRQTFLAYHPEGRLLAIGAGTRVIIFDTKTGREVAEIHQAKKYFLSGAFSPDGRRFLTVSKEETVKCWDTMGWTLVREYSWYVGGLSAVAIAPDGLTAAAGGEKKKIAVFDLDH